MTGEEHAAAVDALAAAAEHTPNPVLASIYRAAAGDVYEAGPWLTLAPGTVLGGLHTLALQEMTKT